MDQEAVLVLGAGGFIGHHLTKALAMCGIPVIAATRTPAALPHPLVRNAVNPFTEPAAFSTLLGSCRSVVHAASISTPGSSMATPQLDGNLRTTLALLEALQSHPDRRLIFLSSAGTLYGERATPAHEDAPLRPRSYHGAGKAAAECFIQAWATLYEGTAVSLRPTNVYGPGQTARQGFAIIPTAMDAASSGKALSIWGDGNQIRDYLHVNDLVKLCLHSLDHPLPSGFHAFNAASGSAITLNGLLGLIESASGRRISRTHSATRPADIVKALVDARAARETFMWKPSVTLSEGLADTWSWHQGCQ